jgi:hypothetical protein
MSHPFTPKTAVVLALAVACTTASAQKAKPQKFSAKQIREGATLFAQN